MPANPIDLDPELIEKMASWGAKIVEIADYFGCSTDTINRRCAAELTKGRANLQMNLRQWQLKSASQGNVAMLIWLGKQMLGQQDRSIIELSKIDDAVFAAEAERRLNASNT